MSAKDFSSNVLYEDWLRKSRKVTRSAGDTSDRAALQRLAGQSLLVRSGIIGTLRVADTNEEVASRKWTDKDASSATHQETSAFLRPDEHTLNRLHPIRQHDAKWPAYKDTDIGAFLQDYPHAGDCRVVDSDGDCMDEDGVEDDEDSDVVMKPERAVGAPVRPLLEPSSGRKENSNHHHSNKSNASSVNPYASAAKQSSALPSACPDQASKSFYATMDYPHQRHADAPPQQLHQGQRDPYLTANAAPLSANGYRSNPSYRSTPSNSLPAVGNPQEHGSNPFQTAAEFARVADQPPQQVHVQAPSGSSHMPPMQHPQSCFNPYAAGNQNLPYSSCSVSSSPPPPPAPVIRESLKRKYQQPIKKSVAAGNQTFGAQATSTGVARYRPPAAATASGSNVAKIDDMDEEELPEALQRYGKELVNKIRDEIMDAGETITFDDIAGLADAKQTVQEVVCWPMKRPDLFTGLRQAPNGLLLFGPPGTGKTLIGKAIAHESGATFFSISSSSLTSKWIGEGEKLVRTLFAVAAYHEPSVVFVDEIDSLLTQRKADENEASRRIKTEFLVQLDGTGTGGQGRVLMIGATNRPQELDEAARRRFTKRLYIPLPEECDREALLRVLLAKNKHALTAEEISKLAKDTAGFSGADLKALCTDAAMGPIRALGAHALEVNCNDVPAISYKHFRQSLRSMNPSVAPADLEQYLAWDELYGNKRFAGDDTDEEGA